MNGRAPRRFRLPDAALGTLVLILGAVGVFLSYLSLHGLPFVPTYHLTVELPDAAQLVRGDEVRIGGARIGTVHAIEAVDRRGARPPFARVELNISKGEGPLPADTRVAVRPRSILGAKFIALTPGRSRRMLASGATLPLRRSRGSVEFSDALQIVDRPTVRGLQATLRGLGDGFAGRGGDLNDTIRATAALMPPLERVLANLADDRTDLAGFLSGAASATRALAPEAPRLAALVDHATVTLGAFEAAGPSLERSLEMLPGVTTTATRALTRLTPVLASARRLAVGLRAGGRLVRPAASDLDTVLRAGTPVLPRVGRLLRRVRGTLGAVDTLARDPAAPRALTRLRGALRALDPLLRRLGPAQESCNVVGLWTRNVSDSVSIGDQSGSFLYILLVVDAAADVASAEPAPDLHSNPYPVEDAGECEAGNEPYSSGRVLGNPAGRQSTHTELTAPPAGARALARRAGLLGGGLSP
jgi:virulence factor Mce-like protein